MNGRIIRKAGPLKGEITVGADKSISHRALLFSALAKGESLITNCLRAEDTLSTCRCMKSLGADIKAAGSEVVVNGCSLKGLREPGGILDCGNSGTTMRLLLGVLAAQPFFSVLSGDASLSRRPMKRLIDPLQRMGARIRGHLGGENPPLAIDGASLKAITYEMPIASAQVKSALILAALYADGVSKITESEKSRDHTEIMLAAMGADIEVDGKNIGITPGAELSARNFIIPGDISSAAFFLVGATIVPGSELKIKEVGINPTRTGLIEVMEKMGASIKRENLRIVGGEMMADLIVTAAPLKAVTVEGEIIPRLIDELPVLAVAMAAAEGESAVRGAGELRVKETDRIAILCRELSKMGADITELEDGFIIRGKEKPFTGARVGSHGDHRLAMSLAIAALTAQGDTDIADAAAVNISFPGFWELLDAMRR